MTETVRLGTIAGVRVGLHWSVLGIVVLLVFGLAGGVLPTQFPDHAPVAYIAAAIVATALFVLSLLAHEVGHAVVAQRNGITVDGITLWLLGGVARLRGDARDAATDFRIAAVGPAISFILGLGFAGATWLVTGIGATNLVAGVLSYLAVINVLLAVFNLIPAAPLDGGRILRSLLWAWRGDRQQAQIWSARAGRVFGLLLIALGIFSLFSDYGGGLWWVLIGLFIVTMASAEEQHARTGAVLGNLTARDIMTSDPDTADARQSIADFVRDVVMVRRHSAFPLLGSSGEVEGMATLNRIRAVPPEQHADTMVSDAACPLDEVPIVRPDDLVSDILGRLGGCADGRALVMDGGRLVGIISPSDISRAMSLKGIGVEPFGGADLNYSDRR
ncbi:site-2 protease family protein [Actinobacteria bacterium YIM 96077]|uniref:Zinc metalloprotease n=1 Tax=Phytoactinopolyspora halophila TaxID=1981511 RepID=A0A329QTY6_9ACTN|nr:site-2 protease family protein [Phytoactinopolyspora halophila]AYY15746.1 site-2 protease family protein [Actinobacteria bacterium YIM 96077]RAW15486.1 site-2 protease family protein [Phytoactinopolyspora halophila]